MTDRTPQTLHIVLATLGVTFLALLILLLLPGDRYDENADPQSEVAAAEDAASASRALRGNVLAWAGAGVAIGASITGGLAALVLLRRASRRLEEGR